MFRDPPRRVVKAVPATPDAVKTAAAAPSVPRSIALNAPPTFVVGDSWSYRVTNLMDGKERETKARIKEVRGDEVHFEAGHIMDAYGNWIRLKRASAVDTFSPPTPWFVFPMRPGNSSTIKTVQTTTEADGRVKVTDSEVKITVIGEEEIVVPAGKMRAIKLERLANWKQRDSDNGGVRTQTYWYSGPVKRLVLIEDKNVTLKGKTVFHERHALVSHSVQ